MKQEFSFAYEVYDSTEALGAEWQQLAEAAAEARGLAWAPYSGFKVGAALLLEDGRCLPGANQENASFPAGLCAERVALATAATQAPGLHLKAIAICYAATAAITTDQILSPCGICRQSLKELQDRQQQAIRVLMIAPTGKCLLVADIDHLLPFGFNADFL